MKARFIDKKTSIPYTLVGDYYLPWGDIPDDDNENKPIGVWGQRRKRYLKANRNGLYAELLISGKLNNHLAEIDQQAQEMFSQLVYEMAKRESATERLKAENQMEWVGRMNSIREQAREVVSSELIYG
ncbi:MAG: TnpV protein [Christensenellales bacterium]|jgi:hypothetical protein